MTREDILEAAAKIFSQKGFEATSMQDIAEAVKLQKGSLYHHFSSKQAILSAVLERAIDTLTDCIQPVIAMPLPLDEKMRRCIGVYLQTLMKYRSLMAVLLLEHRYLEAGQQFQHIVRRDSFERQWRGLVEDGMAAGIFVAGDPGLVTRSLLGILNWTITWYREDGPSSIEEIAAQIADLFLKGLLVCPGRTTFEKDTANNPG